METPERSDKKKAMSENDYEFLIHTRFFDAVPDEAKFQLLASVKPVLVTKGERLIRQGDEGDCLYLVQKGHCAVNLDRNGILFPVAVLGPGDVVGEMAILTGENRSAHVDAQTDMAVWRLNRIAFENACTQHPEIRRFLTHVVSNRFARSTVVADRTVGKYVISEIIGRGGWSVVYKGVHSTLGMPVAVKMLKHDMAMDDDFLSRFQNEARTIANLNHENLVKVYDIEHLYRTVFIIMEYLDGRSLLDLLVEQQKLSPEITLDILLQICRGLDVAHRQGIVHGDIKPGNIFIEKNNRAKLVDFGLACPMGTRSTRIVGTPKYFSPEAIRLGPVDERSDIYSLGLATYRMVTGEEAFFTADISNLCAMHLYEETPDPHKVMPDLPLELREFILKATRKNPGERFQNVGEVIHYLLPLSQRLGLEIGSDAQRRSHMMGLFVFYRDEQKAMIKQLVDDFSHELGKIGTVLRQTDFKDV